jgi:hypothetical protein
MQGCHKDTLTLHMSTQDAASMVSGLQEYPSTAAKAPLTVLMHAGGVLQDATLSGQTLQGLRRVLAPKVAAASAFGGSDPGGPCMPSSQLRKDNAN